MFEGHVVWVTGATAGLGRAMALEFARRGADVAISGRRQDRLEAVAGEIEALGRKAVGLSCDVTDETQVQRAADSAVELLGKLDVAVANAGCSVSGKVERMTADQWRRQLDTNVVGAALTAKHAIPHLRKTRGRLALVGSVAGQVYFPGFAAYQASKAAVRALGHTLAAELHADGISVTTIQPGFVESEIAKVDNDGNFDPDREDKRPARLMWKTDDAARVMVDAIARRRLEFTFTGHGKVGAWLGQHVPSLVHQIARRQTRSTRMERE